MGIVKGGGRQVWAVVVRNGAVVGSGHVTGSGEHN